MQRSISIHSESRPTERTLGNIIYLQCLYESDTKCHHHLWLQGLLATSQIEIYKYVMYAHQRSSPSTAMQSYSKHQDHSQDIIK